MATKYDPQLHILRSVARSLEDPRIRQEAESARFNLFTALEKDDQASALAWLEALEVALKCAEFGLSASTVGSVERAIKTIRGLLAEDEGHIEAGSASAMAQFLAQKDTK